MNEGSLSRTSLDGVLSKLRARRRRMLVAEWAARGLLYGGLCAVLVALGGAIAGADWMRPVPWPALAAIPALVIVGALVGLLWRMESLPLARALDRAAAAEDRFASALQLADHPRQQRVHLATEDALSRVSGTRPEAALPWRAPRELKWLPVPLLALVTVCWLAPGRSVHADAPREPEISMEEWAHIHQDFRRQLDDLDRPESPEEKEVRQELERLVNSLAAQPDKKEVLARIARLQSELNKHQQKLRTREVSIRKAAGSMKGEKPLDKLAESLRQGNYRKSAEELRAMAERLAGKKLKMTAAEFEAASRDFERLSQELARNEELSQACRECASAASSMSSEQLAEALKRLSQTVDKNAEDLRKCDTCRSCNSLLDQLRRRLSDRRCCSKCGKHGCPGCGSLVRRSDKKGGLKAGWGTAAQWDGGKLSEEKDQRLPTLSDAPEGPGANQAFSIVSPEESARSAQEYKELYAEMIRKAEADLALEEVPLAYRDYLRRYFNAIRPEESSSEQPAAEP